MLVVCILKTDDYAVSAENMYAKRASVWPDFGVCRIRALANSANKGISDGDPFVPV